MSVTEYERHQIFQWYEEAMGSERAAIMMNLVPPVGWGEVATRTDLVALGNGLRGEMSVLRSELRGEMAELRGEMSALGSEIRGEMSALQSEIRGDMSALRSEMKAGNAELRSEMKAGNAELLRTLFFAIVASHTTLVGLAFAAMKLA